MTVAPISRVNYFDGQFIRVAELNDEQKYHVQLRRRHNLSHHSWGIVVGLEIVEELDGRAALLPGLAVDGYGRELLLTERRVIDASLFDQQATSRLDVWLEYRLDFSDDRLAPVECGSADPRRRYRATERAQVVFNRAGARPDPRRPAAVAPEAFDEPLLATPDDPRQRWPVYLGRVTMDRLAPGGPAFAIDTADRVYVGLNAEVIDHPGNPGRLELGRRPIHEGARTIGNKTIAYDKGPDRDFAVFVPRPDDEQNAAANEPLHPTLEVSPAGTQIRGTTSVHGNLILDGASLQFPDPGLADPPDSEGHPVLYRAKRESADELRIDMGSLNGGDRRLVLGVTKDGKFHAALEISYPNGTASNPLVTVHGDLRIEGIIKSPDVRTRTVTEEVAALLTGMVQAGQASAIT